MKWRCRRFTGGVVAYPRGGSLGDLRGLSADFPNWLSPLRMTSPIGPTPLGRMPLALSLQAGGRQLALRGAWHSARLRGAISGKNKSDAIDADVLARAGEVFDLRPLVLPGTAELALRRAVTRRACAVIDANRCWRRLVSLGRWAFPDVWNAFAGSLPTATAVLDRWPHLEQLANARRSSLTAVVAEHTRAVGDVPDRVEEIRSAARDWARFWAGRLDLDARPTGRGRARWVMRWKPALNAFAITFEGRIVPTTTN
jgi:hypothetical protein